ncbi:ferritin-like domain-containing protein [Paraburkholderia kirstenboschensis]|uniref:Ferritin-like domain-containing protein n=1 Tax=Paraburkholderia kirstenboschensis TaxID=1245436 RepID=A0ABZ0EGX0_9BURK|nr:ferritin-like domain-containing protein [Paraburkholderia kirstenboschensis]WOD15413.1 ferritin-like domain-containing protein [Paraburkholderia kirstenboschensis]
MSDTLIDVADDHNLRHWAFTGTARVKVGSETHKHMFCRMLLETHDPYKPAVINWPALSPDALERLCSLPIWDIAVQTEGRASIDVHTYAAQLSDPLLREAITMDGDEEARHKRVLAKLIAAYGIEIAPEPHYPPPRDPEWAWMRTGYSECIDSFFAFGLFRAAQQSGYFPEALVETFEPVIQEEARHILFFVNWVAWHRHNMPLWRRPWHALRVAAIWAVLIWERVAIARGIDANGVAHDSNFLPANSSVIGKGLETPELIELCLAENDRRMSGYDVRLLRPRLVPALARFALRFIKRSRRTGTA